MKRRANIQRWTASLLLLLFAISITPQKLLHHCLTDHTHILCLHHSNHIEEAAFNCHHDQLVVHKFFLGVDGFISAKPVFTLSILQEQVKKAVFPGFFRTHDSRGPPASQRC